MAPPNVHSFYRIWFTWVDPAVLTLTIVGVLKDPTLLTDPFVPVAVARPDPLMGFLFHQIAALYGFVGLIHAGLQRASSDIVVWNWIQGATFAVDIALLGSSFATLQQQGRLDVGDVRAAEWGSIGFTALVAVIRGFFLLGVGNGRSTAAAGKKRA